MKELWVPDRRLHLPPPTKYELGKLPIFGAFVEVGAWGRERTLTQQFREISHSPVQQFLQILLSQMRAADQAILDTGNTSRTVDFNVADSHMGVTAAADIPLYNIYLRGLLSIKFK